LSESTERTAAVGDEKKKSAGVETGSGELRLDDAISDGLDQDLGTPAEEIKGLASFS